MKKTFDSLRRCYMWSSCHLIAICESAFVL